MKRSSKLRYVLLRKMLPAHDSMAGLAARALVLLADLSMEKRGLRKDSAIDALDDFDQDYRLLMFFRSNLRTLYSARRLTKALEASRAFRSWLGSATVEQKAIWSAGSKLLKRHAAEIDQGRNRMGAHAEESIETAIRAVKGDVAGWLEFSDNEAKPRLATEILLATLVSDLPSDEWLEALHEKVAHFAEATGAVLGMLQVAIILYVREHPPPWN